MKRTFNPPATKFLVGFILQLNGDLPALRDGNGTKTILLRTSCPPRSSNLEL